MHRLHRICQVLATATLATAAGAQAAPGCAEPSADALLDTPPPSGQRGFALTQRLCGAALVRTPSSAPVLPEATEPDRPEAPRLPELAPAPAPAAPVADARRVPRTSPAVRSRDTAALQRIRALAPLMADVAQRHDIDPLLLHAVAHIESRHQSQAISPAGARGLMQVMPATGRSLGVAEADRALLTPEANLEASARYLKRLQARFGNDLRLVLAAYNAGEGAVERHGRRVPPFTETQAYVRNVLAVYGELRRHFGGGAA